MTEPGTPLEKLRRVIEDAPCFHRSETEVDRPFAPTESLLPSDRATALAAGGLTCYGVGEDVLSYIWKTVGDGSRTLETGAGVSTLVFALRRCHHVAITPSEDEIGRIRSYAAERDIPLDRVDFVAEPSDAYLPRSPRSEIDMALIDGKHAFPWPIVDWFFTADRLRRGGVMIIDDVHIPAVAILAEFLRRDPAWERVHDLSGKSLAFKKLRDSIHDVTWHMQPFNIAPAVGPPARSPLLRQIARRLKRLAGS